MRKKWIYLGAVVMIIAAAFLFPRLMLWLEQRRAEERVLTYGTGTLLNFDELSLGEKQRLLAQKVTVVTDTYDDPLKCDLLFRDFSAELKKLRDYGAILPISYEFLNETLRDGNIQLCTAFDASGAKSFRFYMLSGFDGVSFAFMDLESKKILSLGAAEPMEEALQGSTSQNKGELHSSSYEARLRSWAEYYGMYVEHLQGYVSEAEPQGEGSHLILCSMQSNDTDSFGFSLRMDPYTDGWEWSAAAAPDQTLEIEE